jgi:hypothetical protein
MSCHRSVRSFVTPGTVTAICTSVYNIVDVPYISLGYFEQNPGQSVTRDIWSATVIFVKNRALKTVLVCVKECQFLLITFIARFARYSISLHKSTQNVAENS